jgi:hypothetical protein
MKKFFLVGIGALCLFQSCYVMDPYPGMGIYGQNGMYGTVPNFGGNWNPYINGYQLPFVGGINTLPPINLGSYINGYQLPLQGQMQTPWLNNTWYTLQ